MIKKIFLIIFIIFTPIYLLAEGGSNNPQVTITPSLQSVTEGNSGTKTLTFTISVDKCPNLMPIKIKYNTSNGSASAGSDYIQESGTIEFNTPFFFLSCQKSYTIDIKIKGDKNSEPNENFYIQLSNNGTNSYQSFHWGSQKATITIENDDTPPTDNYADIEVSKSNNIYPNKAKIGDLVTYTITAKNNGPKISEIYISDKLPKYLDFVSFNENISNFSCRYKSSNRYIKCWGSHKFSKNQVAKVTIKAKVKNTKKETIKNSAYADSNNGINDNNKNNNSASSSFKVKRIDIKAKKYIKNRKGKYVDSLASAKVNDTVKFKITISNQNEHPTKINLDDTLPDSIKFLSVNIDGNPSNYKCNKYTNSNGNDAISCSGNKLFSKNDSLNIYIDAKVTKKGRFINAIWADSDKPDIYYDHYKHNNYDTATVDVDINSKDEKIKIFTKDIISPIKSRYYIGDIVTFEIDAKTTGSSERIRVRDFEQKYGTTKDAFEFLEVKSLNNNVNCKIRGSGRNKEAFCEANSALDANKYIKIQIKAQIKKSGDICNGTHYYKEYTYSYGKDFKWMKYAQKCFSVYKPNAKPILNADKFYVQLNVPDSIDLKDYTTDADTPKEKLTYKIVKGSLPSGYSMTEDGTISGNYTNSNGLFPKNFNLTVEVTDDTGLSTTDSFTIVVKADEIKANDNYYEIPINQQLNGNLILDSQNSGSNQFKPDKGVQLQVTNVEPSDSKLTWNSSGDFIFKAPNTTGTYQFKYDIKDKYGQTDYALLKIKVFKPIIKANDDKFKVAKNTPLHDNIFSDHGSGIDVGDDIKVIKHSNTSHGTLTLKEDGTIIYTPNQDYKGTDSFTYTIKDKYNQTDKATVLLTIGELFVEGYVEFSLVNPPETRNMIGSYLTIGNSVECITDKKGLPSEKDSFSGSCQNNISLSNNDYVVKYIDIDTKSGTWNSSSANFELPDSYLNIDEGKGIAWAGIFWQGSINNRSGFKQRRAIEVNSNSYKYKNITYSEPINLASSNANKVLIKIDNQTNYDEVKADTFYNDLAHGNYGGYYAAYSNITKLLQSKKLSKGKHKITIANIVTNEGRESDIGNYAGWSLIIIYKENFNGKPRNISIYNGYQPIGKGGSTNIPSKEVKITGFKLPKAGSVESTIGAFVGEGEQKYGGTSIVYDKMYIKDVNSNKIYDMPSQTPSNIFDATLENIDRDSGKYNNINNTNGIDVDSYNVSSIMQNIRDIKPDTNTIKIGIISKDENLNDGDQSDYITASMISFATELYAPKVCYDYDLKLGDYIDLPSNDRNFTTNNFANDSLQLKIMLRSQEADFDLIESKLSAIFNPNSVFKYKIGSAKTTKPNTYYYEKAIEIDTNKGVIAIGDNPSTNGGTLGAKVTTYSKLYYNFIKPTFSGKFDIILDAKISFDGINKVPYQMSTLAPKESIFSISRCDSNPTYDPIYGMFNVERGDSKFSQPEDKRYSLYTQVVGVPYKISLASYTKDNNNRYTKPINSSSIVELELINGSNFDNNSSAKFDSVCQDPDTYDKGVFIDFKDKNRVFLEIPKDYPTYPKTLALKNAAFRVWVLTKKSGDNRVIINHKCHSQEDSQCFDKLYNIEYKNSEDNNTKFCANACNNSSGSKCYNCLREHFAMPVCSRDNFAIRPDSYSISISDNNQTQNLKKVNIGINNSSSFKHIAADYLYNLDINATIYNTRDNVSGYYFVNEKNSTNKQSIAKFIGLPSCLNKSNYNLNTSIINGKTRGIEPLDINSTSIPMNRFIVKNSGEYATHLEDWEWTEVDQKGYKYKPFPNIEDCIQNSTISNAGNLNIKRGCGIKTDTTATYPDLKISLHPYTFDINTITAKANPNTSSKFIYINDLNSTQKLIKNNSVMALKVSGDITAIGKNGSTLNNYTDNCSAYDLNIKQYYSLDSTINTKLNYIIYDNNIDTNNKLYINTEDNTTTVNLLFKKKYFYKPSIGSYISYYNFKREYNKPINPFKTTFGIISVTSPKEKIFVNMKKDYIPNASKDLNITKTIYYAKVKSKSDFYDDIYTNSIETPIEVTLFCNKSLNYCSKYGIDVSKSLTNEYDWWLAINHNGLADGKALLKIDDSTKVELKPSSVFDHFVKGVDTRAKVIKKVGTKLPYTTYIQPTSNMITNYPWLLFNKADNTPPKYITKIRFVKSSDSWSGKGKTGYATDYNSTGRRTKKVDW